jgi:hypothetical protein
LCSRKRRKVIVSKDTEDSTENEETYVSSHEQLMKKVDRIMRELQIEENERKFFEHDLLKPDFDNNNKEFDMLIDKVMNSGILSNPIIFIDDNKNK